MVPNDGNPIPYDVIYDVFLKTDDYCTLNHFWVLDKYFYTQYMNRNRAFKHRFGMLFNQIFTFLSLLPDTKLIEEDVDFFTVVSCQSLEHHQKQELFSSIKFMFSLYKNFMWNEFNRLNYTNYIRANARDLTNMCLIQGPNFLDRYCQVNFAKNKVKLTPYLDCTRNNFRYLMSFCKLGNYRYMHNQIILFETFFC